MVDETQEPVMIGEGELKDGQRFRMYRAEAVGQEMARRISYAIVEGHAAAISRFRRLVSGEVEGIRALSYYLDVNSRIVSQVTVLSSRAGPAGILTFVATVPEARRKGAVLRLLEASVREYFDDPGHKCLLLHTSIDTFRRQLYERFGFRVIIDRGLMECFGNLPGEDFESMRKAFDEEYFSPGAPARPARLSWGHAPGLNVLFAAETGWSYRSHRFGIVGPSQVEMQVYRILEEFEPERRPGEARVLLSGDGKPVGIFMAGPDPRFEGKVWTVDIFVSRAFERDAHLLVQGFSPPGDVYAQAFSGTEDEKRVSLLEAAGLELKTTFPCGEETVGLWAGRLQRSRT